MTRNRPMDGGGVWMCWCWPGLSALGGRNVVVVLCDGCFGRRWLVEDAAMRARMTLAWNVPKLHLLAQPHSKPARNTEAPR